MLHIHLDPILFQWGPIALRWHGLWVAAGLIAGYLVFEHQSRSRGIKREHVAELCLGMFVVGYLGARLMHVLYDWESYLARPADILAVHKGGLRLYGALIGILVVMLVYVRYRRLSFWMLADSLGLALPVVVIVARVGCTINGDRWGLPTDGSWGLVYWHPDASIPAHLRGVPTFPLPIALQLWSAGLLILLLVLRKRLSRPGLLFLIAMIGYSLGRFVVGAWQPEKPFLFGLGQTRVVALGVVGLGMLVLALMKARTASRPTDQQ